MMKVRFRKSAESDLNGIVEWYDAVAPESLQTVLADIYRSIEQLAAYPRSGPKVPGRNFRRLVTHRFHFKIAYEVDDSSITILGIFRYQNRVT
jgi:plasmid stabilization system protein ParE